MDFYQSCIEKTVKFCKALYLPEEAIISLLFDEYNIKYDEIDSSIYALQPQKESISEFTKGIHSCGQPKFWNGLNNNQWNAYYKIWLEKYNGEPFSNSCSKKISFKKIVKCILPYGIIRLYRRHKKHGK